MKKTHVGTHVAWNIFVACDALDSMEACFHHGIKKWKVIATYNLPNLTFSSCNSDKKY